MYTVVSGEEKSCGATEKQQNSNKDENMGEMVDGEKDEMKDEIEDGDDRRENEEDYDDGDNAMPHSDEVGEPLG